MPLTILYVSREHCFVLNIFRFFFPHLTLTIALKKRKGQVVLLWKHGPVVKLYCSFLLSDSDNVSCSTCTHDARLTSHHYVSCLQSILSIPLHPIPFHTKASYWNNSNAREKPRASMSDLGSNPHSTSRELCDITSPSFSFCIVRCRDQYPIHRGLVRTEWWGWMKAWYKLKVHTPMLWFL